MKTDSASERVKTIIADGKDIRSKVADVVREAVAIIHETGESLSGVTKSVMDGAAQAAAGEIGKEGASSALREVIDGVGDGIASTTQAIDLAVAEARGKGEQFAHEDLSGLVRDLRSVGQLFVETTGRALSSTSHHLKEQVSDLTAHAERTAERVRPGLESAASAAAHDIEGVVSESARAGISAVRQGTGALFTALGSLFQKTGDLIKVQPETDDKC